MKLKVFIIITTVACGFFSNLSVAAENFDATKIIEDPEHYLESVSAAAHHLNYEGTFVVQHDTKMLASKIVHCSNGNELTKINTLDGTPREIISTNDEVRSFYPMVHSIRLEQGQIRRFFPNLITQPVDNYLRNYTLRYLGDDRVASRNCHVIEFVPKDNMRYPHVFCIDDKSNLLLRSSTLSSSGEPLVTAFFTEIKLDKYMSPKELAPTFKNTKDWHVENIKLDQEIDKNVTENWRFNTLPDGFKKISEFTRTSPHHNQHMIHQMYSDGLSSFSVFIEDNVTTSTANQLIASKIIHNSLSFYSVQINNHTVTVVGDLPMTAVKDIVSSLTFKRSSDQ